MLELFPIPQIPMYTVTKCGKVYSYYSNMFLKLKAKRGPYFVLNLTIKPGPGKIQKMHDVHKLMLWTFKGVRPPGKEAAHLDSNPENNHIDNLDWVSHKENIKHQIYKESGRYSKSRKKICKETKLACVKERLNGASYVYLENKYQVTRRAVERWVVKFKDQVIIEVNEKQAEKAARLLDQDALQELNRQLGGLVPLKGEAQVIDNLAEAKNLKPE